MNGGRDRRSRMRKTDTEEQPRLPIKLGPASNGEFVPLPATELLRQAEALAWENAARNARRTGRSRRDFLRSACGGATTLLALNACSKRGTGARYEIPGEAALDLQAAQAALGGKEFIFD